MLAGICFLKPNLHCTERRICRLHNSQTYEAFISLRLMQQGIKRGSRNLVGIAIQLSDSEEEEFFVGYPMLISPEKFDFGIE